MHFIAFILYFFLRLIESLLYFVAYRCKGNLDGAHEIPRIVTVDNNESDQPNNFKHPT